MGDVIDFPEINNENIITIECVTYNIDKNFYDSLTEDERECLKERVQKVCVIMEDLLNM